MNAPLKMLKSSFTGMKKYYTIAAFALVVYIMFVYRGKFMVQDGMNNGGEHDNKKNDINSSDVNYIDDSILDSGAATSSGGSPSDLLPSSNNEWDVLNQVGTTQGTNPDLLQAGYHHGLDTISQSLRNANLQVRSDPVIPIVNTGPWNQSTMEATNLQVPFNIGR